MLPQIARLYYLYFVKNLEVLVDGDSVILMTDEGILEFPIVKKEWFASIQWIGKK